MSSLNKFFENISSAFCVNAEDDSLFYIIYNYDCEDQDDNYLEFGEALDYYIEYKEGQIVENLSLSNVDDKDEVETQNLILEKILQYSKVRCEKMKG